MQTKIMLNAHGIEFRRVGMFLNKQHKSTILESHSRDKNQKRAQIRKKMG